jgi:DNA-binding NtrC family response regulator
MARILVVDDERLVAQTIGDVLTLGGHEVIYAGLDEDPSSVVVSQAYDLLLTDIFLPETSGWDLIRSSRQLRPELPVIAISGGGIGISADTALKLGDLFGAAVVLQKPVDAATLLEAVNTALR